MAKAKSDKKFITQNRRARFDYLIQDTLEAGIMLFGSEVKSLRQGHGSVNEAYAGEKDGELYLINSYIQEYTQATHFNHESKRPRKLLVKRKERDRLLDGIRRKGTTLVPISLYFNERGIVKLELGLAQGKRKADKRAAEKERDWKRDKDRLMKDKG
jgi:SsrA-binding protein